MWISVFTYLKTCLEKNFKWSVSNSMKYFLSIFYLV